LLLYLWQGHRQTAASAKIHERIAEVGKAERQTGREAVAGLVAEIQTVKSTQARTEGSLAKLSDFSAKIDGWQATQGALSGQLKAVQGEMERLAGQQVALTLSTSNQTSELGRRIEHGLSAVRDEFEGQLKLLREDGERLATRQAAYALATSNQVVALRQAIDREHALVSEIDRHRVENERLQSDYQALTTRHEQMPAAAGLAGKPPSVTLAVPGVSTSVSGKEIIVTFEDGIFDHGTHFKPGARDRLLAVGKALAGSAEPLEVKVVGYADDDRAFLKWTARWESALALERASAVVSYFIELGLFKPQKLLGVAGDSQKRPFASDSMQNRMRNRTVVLKVTVDRQN
jgi:flagellar motor protein MotB